MKTKKVSTELDIILGSQSLRRHEILSYFSLPFKTVVSHYDETLIPFQGDPNSYVLALSQGKAEALSPLYPLNLILTADTVVYRQGKVYGKPSSKEQGFEYLKELSGRTHTVLTGLTLIHQNQCFQRIESTSVRFNKMTDAQIMSYQEAIPWSDKAGGYMIQKAGSIIVNRIEGCYYNVMGLPVHALAELLINFDIDLWSYLKDS